MSERAIAAQPKGSSPISMNRSSVLQRKLAIAESDDPMEREADRVADHAMTAQIHPAANGTPPRIQRFSGPSNGQMDSAPASVEHALSSSGRPLEPALRRDMESRFGHDFSHVRVHSGGAAERSAQEVNANAYTVGHDLVFGPGRFAPGTHEGRRLLAHELAHVVQQGATGTVLQRRPTNGRAVGSAAEGQCIPGPSRMDTPWKNGHKTKARDIDIEYYLVVTPGHFCDMRPQTVALLQYERKVQVRTSHGHEAILRINASADILPPFSPKKSDFRQLHVRAWSDVHWDVEVKYATALAGGLTGWHTPAPGHIHKPALELSLTEYAAHQAPSFVHFGLSPEEQRQTLEAFVEASAVAEIPEERKRVAEWEKHHPQSDDDTQPPMHTQPTVKSRKSPIHPPINAKQPKTLDDETLRKMSETQRYDLARKEVWKRTKAKLKHMWDHPGEALKGFAEGALLVDTPEVFSAIGDDLTELFDSDATAWAHAAAAAGILGKLAGWLAAVVGIAALVLYAASFFVGVGELATLVVAGVALLATAITSAAVESVLRAKAASKSATVKDFDHQVDASSGALTSGIVGGALIVAGSVLHIFTKGLRAKITLKGIKGLLDDFRRRLKNRTRAKPDAGAQQPAAPDQPAAESPKSAEEPKAVLPDGKSIPPDSYSGGYHGTDLSPDVVMKSGLPPRGANWNLQNHAEELWHYAPADKQVNDSAFRGTTSVPSDPANQGGAAYVAGKGGYVYEIRGVPTWDVNKALQGRVGATGSFRGNLMHGEGEYAIPAEVPPGKIVRWGVVKEDARGRLYVEWHTD